MNRTLSCDKKTLNFFKWYPFLSNSNINIEETARRYAKALFLVSDSDKSNTLETRKSFDEFIQLFNTLSELRFFFKSPLTNPGKKKLLIKKVLAKTNLSENFSNFLVTLASNGKLFLIEKIYKEFNKILDSNDGVLEVSVTTTEPLNKVQEKKIINSLEKKLKSSIKLKKEIDKNIIGGIILKINSIMIDNSIKNKLVDYNTNERFN